MHIWYICAVISFSKNKYQKETIHRFRCGLIILHEAHVIRFVDKESWKPLDKDARSQTETAFLTFRSLEDIYFPRCRRPDGCDVNSRVTNLINIFSFVQLRCYRWQKPSRSTRNTTEKWNKYTLLPIRSSFEVPRPNNHRIDTALLEVVPSKVGDNTIPDKSRWDTISVVDQVSWWHDIMQKCGRWIGQLFLRR